MRETMAIEEIITVSRQLSHLRAIGDFSGAKAGADALNARLTELLVTVGFSRSFEEMKRAACMIQQYARRHAHRLANPCGAWRWPSLEQLRMLDAVRKVQRYRRTLQEGLTGKRMRALWPSLAQLKRAYLDKEAVTAGALRNELYTDEMIVRRETLRTDRLVRDALKTAWTICMSAAAPAGGSLFPRESYSTMSRKVAHQPRPLPLDLARSRLGLSRPTSPPRPLAPLLATTSTLCMLKERLHPTTLPSTAVPVPPDPA